MESEKVGFIGLGKLGLPCAAAISNSLKTSVVGFDVNPRIEEYVKESRVPYIEEMLEDYLQDSNVEVLSSIAEVVAKSTMIFFAVQTPHLPKFEGNSPVPDETCDFDYSYLKSAVQQVCDEIQKQNRENILLVVISTVLPGTMRREVLPIIENSSVTIDFCYNPFFIAMGTTIKDFLHPEFILIGSDNPNSSQRLRTFYNFIDAPKEVMEIESAELTKVAYNTFIGFKIVFANTISEICSEVGGNCDEVTDALASATSRLMSPRYLRAGMADGGGCHPRDQIAMSELAKRLNLSVNTFDWLARARDKQTYRQASTLMKLQQERGLPIVLLGRAYKRDINLVVGSPADLLGFFLEELGANYTFFDPIVEPGSILTSNPAIFFVSTNHSIFRKLRVPPGSICVDPWGDALNADVNESVTFIKPGRE